MTATQPTVDSEVVERLLRFRSDEAPVLSVYIGVPVDPGELRSVESRFRSAIRPVRELADADDTELGHYARQSLRTDIDRALEVAGRGTSFLGRGVAVFSCSQKGLYEEVVLPRGLRDRAVVDSTPYLRPLLAVLDESHRYCVVILDREHAWLYEFWMGRLEDEEKIRGEGVRKRDYAGWHGLQERGTLNRAEQLARRHFHQTAEAVEDFMTHRGAELLVVGGHQETVANFLPFLTAGLQSRVAGTFAVDPGTMSAGRVRELADGVVDGYERDEERRLVADALDKAAGGGRAAVGLDWCLAAARDHAIDLLLVHDEAVAAGRACDSCGWLGVEGDTCPVSGDPTRSSPDVVEELAAAVIDAGGRVEHVFAATQLSTEMVAATLRFKVPRPA